MRTAIVTGAGRGIGAAVAAALAREGVSVLGVARTESEVAAVCDRILAEGGSAHPCVADVSAEGTTTHVMRTCETHFGAPDVLVNCAGVQGAIGPFEDSDLAAWWRVVEVNLRGSVAMCAAVLPAMIDRGRGSIINFSGGGATAPRPFFSAYAASKAAVVRFTETLAEEVAVHGIAVNAIAPGVVDTRMQDDVLRAGAARAGPEFDRMRRLRETGQGGVPAELAAALTVHLALGRAWGLTGKLISAPHDDWREWDEHRIRKLTASPWLTLRRLDQHTIEPLLADGRLTT